MYMHIDVDEYMYVRFNQAHNTHCFTFCGRRAFASFSCLIIFLFLLSLSLWISLPVA